MRVAEGVGVRVGAALVAVLDCVEVEHTVGVALAQGLGVGDMVAEPVPLRCPPPPPPPPLLALGVADVVRLGVRVGLAEGEEVTLSVCVGVADVEALAETVEEGVAPVARLGVAPGLALPVTLALLEALAPALALEAELCVAT